jgi:hypothetical protein
MKVVAHRLNGLRLMLQSVIQGVNKTRPCFLADILNLISSETLSRVVYTLQFKCDSPLSNVACARQPDRRGCQRLITCEGFLLMLQTQLLFQAVHKQSHL